MQADNHFTNASAFDELTTPTFQFYHIVHDISYSPVVPLQRTLTANAICHSHYMIRIFQYQTNICI